MDDIRRAALTLHALQEHDRQWILGRLGSGVQQTLNVLLAELAELGIPQDSTLIQEALNEPLRQVDDAVDEPAWRKELAAADPQALLSVLGTEPPGFVARVLAAGPWPWEAFLLASMSAPRREDLLTARNALATQQVSAGMLDEWLAQRVLQRAAGRVVMEHEATRTSPEGVA